MRSSLGGILLERPVRQDQGFSVQISPTWKCEGISFLVSGGKTEVSRKSDMEIKEKN